MLLQSNGLLLQTSIKLSKIPVRNISIKLHSGKFMKLTLKPTVTAVLLALSGQGLSSSFEVLQRKDVDLTTQKKVVERKTLKLNAAEFDPVFEKMLLPDLLENNKNSGEYGLVQFFNDDTQAANRLESFGAKIVGYLPHDTFIVQWNSSSKHKLSESNEFRYVGNYQNSFKISPALWSKVSSSEKRSSDSMTVELVGFKGVSIDDLQKLLQKYSPGSEISQSKTIDETAFIRLTLNQQLKETILNLARSGQVMWIDNYLPLKTHNIDSVGPIQSDSTEITGATIWSKGIVGTGQIVAVADSGLDRNQDFFSQYNTGSGAVSKRYTDAVSTTGSNLGELHPENKVIGYFVQPGATAYDDNEECVEGEGGSSFHGTHVAGTVAGDSGTPASATSANYDNGDGMAPHAQILFQDIGNSETGCLSGTGGYHMFVQAAKAGAGISSNSYGSLAEDPASDGYKFNDYEVDKASYDIEDMLIVFAAGNDGNAGLGHPAHAKNVLAVGALGHGNSTSTAVFSGRGPSYDGRVKPDIMAPGSGIVSAAGNTDNSVPPAQSSNALSSKSGTSMATPTVSGGAALMRQYFMDGFYPDGIKNASNALKPSGAMLKTVLLNGTKLRTRVPSIDQGWGRIFLDNNLYFPGDSRDLRVWDLPNSNGLSTGEEMVFKVQVPAGEPFRATLSWFDPPASLGNGEALINDLDLEVRFNGQTYKGNNWSFGESIEGGDADDIDTVEQIHIANPGAGTYELVVKGTQVNGIGTSASRKQGFALASSQKHCATGVNGTPGLAVSDSVTGEPLITVDPISGVADYQVYRKLGGCAVDNSQYKFIGLLNTLTDQLSLADFGTESGETYGYGIRAVDACGEADYSTCKEITSSAACALDPQFNTSTVQVANTIENSCGVALQWSVANSLCGDGGVKYNIYRSLEAGFTPTASNLVAQGVSGNFYEDRTVANGEMYHYIVTAVDELGNEALHFDSKQVLTTGDSFTPGDYLDDPDTTSSALLGSGWQVTERRASTGTKSFHNAQDNFNYEANTCSFVTLPEIQIQQGGASLSYDVLYNLEATWDGVVVQISSNGGDTWVDLPPAGGYPSSFASTEPTPGQPINACGFRSTQGAFSGAQNTFANYQSDLSAFAGENVIIRWGFSSDPGAEEEGFYLDNIKVTNASSPGACEVAAINQFTSGPWFNPAQSGHGFFLELIPGSNNAADRLNSYWYTFLEGEPRWVFGNGAISGDSATIDMYITNGPVSPPNYDINDLNVEYWGDLTFDFSSDIAGDISWNSEIASFGSGSMPINKLANVSDSPKACLSGSYSNAGQSGHGFVVEIVGSEGSENVLISWYSYDSAGEQIWLIGQAPLQGDTASVPVSILSGADFPPDFDSQDVVNEQWGVLNLDFSEVNKMLVTWQTTYPGYENGQLNTDKFTLLKGKGCL